MADDVPTEVPNTVGQYVIIKTLGSGAFATVYMAQHTVTMAMVALKCIAKRKLRNQAEFELLQREINLMRSMDHPFIASFFEVLDDEKNFYISIEMVENGNLLDYINSNRGLQEQQARRIFCQLITVLSYLHVEKHVVHRDLKAENVLLDRNFNVRLVDFGLSKAFSKTDPFLQTTCGSPAYVAPEIIKEKPYTSAADIWSLGVLLYAMVVVTLPFNGDNISFMLQQIISVNPPIPNSLSPELRSLISRLLNKEPGARITLQEIIQHPWISEFEDSKLMSEDFGLINTLKVVNPQELDSGVVSEMRILGYDTAGLLQELKSGAINQRTAAYKMFKRQRTIEEINNWQNVRASRTKGGGGPEKETKLPALENGILNGSPSVKPTPSKNFRPRLRYRSTVPVK
ncbi:CAMK family protein kinase [Tritrichomonas foetus]|uniref:non-specific serine/threonine protein kinase n=1 Tax=Tritrichomonas foetus TaxID=1144522 RepID=A0A1J4JNP0_9EUKA|nr:CAMK family protein kinase [Tritrichomonas foetus]|eukprot:OHS99133.1 CAMK family protein kinase [Tritrichomonas foetus]